MGNIITRSTIVLIVNTISKISNKKGVSTNSERCDIFKKVKVKDFKHNSRVVKFGFATLLYAKVPKIGNSGAISRKQFTECYGLSFKGLVQNM